MQGSEALLIRGVHISTGLDEDGNQRVVAVDHRLVKDYVMCNLY